MAKMRVWTLSLPPYEPDRPCPKCGHATASTRYCIGARPDRSSRACSRLGYGKAEHLDRECTRCHYEWAEQVLPPPACPEAMAEAQAAEGGAAVEAEGRG